MNRKKWDKFFFELCCTVGRNSSCLSRNIGAVIATKDNIVLSTGYNGPPRGIPHCSERFKLDSRLEREMENIGKGGLEFGEGACPRKVLGFKSGEGIGFCIAAHAERNCIVNAARVGVSVLGGTLYLNAGIPCTPCFIEILNAGIEEVVCIGLDYYDEQVEYLMQYGDVMVRKYEDGVCGTRNGY